MKYLVLPIILLILISGCTQSEIGIAKCNQLRDDKEIEERQWQIGECITNLAVELKDTSICEIEEVYTPGPSGSIYNKNRCLNEVYNALAQANSDDSYCDKIDAAVKITGPSVMQQSAGSNSSNLKESCYSG